MENFVFIGSFSLLSSHSCFLFHVIRVEYGDGLAINPDGALLLEFGQAAEERELLDTEDIRHFLAADIQSDGSALLFGSHLDEVLRHLLLDGERESMRIFCERKISILDRCWMKFQRMRSSVSISSFSSEGLMRRRVVFLLVSTLTGISL